MSIVDPKNALSLMIMQGQRVFDAVGSRWRLFHNADLVSNSSSNEWSRFFVMPTYIIQ